MELRTANNPALKAAAFAAALCTACAPFAQTNPSLEGKPFSEVLALANERDAYAQFYLGLMYDTGEGIPQDDTLAVHWFRQAAEQGDSNGQVELGIMYAQGKGVVEQD